MRRALKTPERIPARVVRAVPADMEQRFWRLTGSGFPFPSSSKLDNDLLQPYRTLRDDQ